MIGTIQAVRATMKNTFYIIARDNGNGTKSLMYDYAFPTRKQAKQYVQEGDEIIENNWE